MKNDKIDILVLNHVDPDGYCAGAIVRYFEKREGKTVENYGMNYGYKIPWSKIKKAKKVYMVDFSLRPHDMGKIQEIVGYENFIWIDHHKTVIEDVENSGRDIYGSRLIGKAGCELTWEWFEAERECPKSVRMIGRYDVWDVNYSNEEEGIKSEDLFPFITGVKHHTDTAEDDHFWFNLFDNQEWVEEVLKEGRLLYEYQTGVFSKYCKSHSFDMEWEGLRFICVNSLNANSQMFEAKWDANKYDAMLSYGYTNKNWSVSMYSDKKEIDVGEVAHKYGGGGHKGACGFTCLKLPFEHLLEWKKE